MMICGTYGSKRKSCNNCNSFMLWGVAYGHCLVHREDFPAQYVCNKFKKYKPHKYFKEILINDKKYYIDRYVNDKKTVFTVFIDSDSSVLKDIECKYFYTLRDVINAIKEVEFNKI